MNIFSGKKTIVVSIALMLFEQFAPRAIDAAYQWSKESEVGVITVLAAVFMLLRFVTKGRVDFSDWLEPIRKGLDGRKRKLP